MEVLTFWQWAVTHGVNALLAGIVAGLCWVVYTQHKENMRLQQARIDDMKEFTATAGALNDKVHKTVTDFAKIIDYNNRRPR